MQGVKRKVGGLVGFQPWGEKFIPKGSQFGRKGSVRMKVREGRLCCGFGGLEELFPGGGPVICLVVLSQ